MLLHSKDWAQVSSPCLRAQQPQGGVWAQEPGARQQSSTSRCDGAQHSFRNPSELRFPVCCVNVTMASRRVPRVVERIKRRDRRGVDSLLSCAVLRTYRVGGRRFPLRSRRGPAGPGGGLAPHVLGSGAIYRSCISIPLILIPVSSLSTAMSSTCTH